MVRVDRATLESGDRVLDEARLVERVGVDVDLDVELVTHGEAVVDNGRCRSPILAKTKKAHRVSELPAHRRAPDVPRAT